MPHLIHVYIRQVIIGYAISAAFVALLLWLNVANLWHLVTHVDVGWVAVLMLWVFNGIVFAGVQFALALPSGQETPGGGARKPSARLLPDWNPLSATRPIPLPIDDDTPSRRP